MRKKIIVFTINLFLFLNIILSGENIHEAVLKGDLNLLKKILSKSPQLLNAPGQGESTPLNTACWKGHLEVVKELLKRGADIHISNVNKTTPLHCAAICGKVEIAKLLINKGAKINIQNKYGWAALHFAVKYNHLDMVKYLLDKGTKIEILNKNLQSPLNISKSLEIAKLLITRGANVSTKSNSGMQPIHNAAKNGNVDLVEFYLKKGIKVDAKIGNGMTPIHFAAFSELKNNDPVMELLLKYGADIDVGDNDGATPLYYAISFKNLEKIKSLISLGADVNKKGKEGFSPLYQACGYGKVEIVKILINSGAKINIKFKGNATPLHLATAFGFFDIVELLIKKGADLNVFGKFIGTPLHQVRVSGSKEIEKLLLKNGAREIPRNFPKLKGTYLGQKDPGIVPKIFAPGIIKNLQTRLSCPTFSFDGKKVYWVVSGAHLTNSSMWFMELKSGFWTFSKRVISMSEGAQAPDLSFTNNNKIYYTSSKVLRKDKKRRDKDMYYSIKTGNKWGKPVSLDTINSRGHVTSLSVGQKDTLYWSDGGLEDSFGSNDIYMSKIKNGKYVKPVNLGKSINGKHNESSPVIAPDGSYIIFTSTRPGGIYFRDAYISFKKKDGSFAKPMNLSKEIGEFFRGKISPDGKYLFFVRGTNFDIYWVSTKVFEKYKKKIIL